MHGVKWNGDMGKALHTEYEIKYTKAAEKFFEKHRAVREQYENALKELLTGDNPGKVDLKRIQGKGSTYYRIRLGDYRVVFAIINGKIVVILTLLAGSRGDIYKKISGLK